jgi:hypothetical protein
VPPSHCYTNFYPTSLLKELKSLKVPKYIQQQVDAVNNELLFVDIFPTFILISPHFDLPSVKEKRKKRQIHPSIQI